MEEVQVAAPKKGEVRIKIVNTALCHTDAHLLSGKDSEAIFPIILGHEGSGIVESVGEGVTSVAPGDHVVPLYMPECRECKFCKSGKTNLCSVIRVTQGKGLMPDGTSRFTCKGQVVYHFMGCSTFSEYTVMPEISVAKVNPSVDHANACLLGCGVSTGYGAATITAKVEKGAKVAVFGAGGVGLAVMRGCVEVGASMIIAIDTNPKKEELARKFGATHFLNPKDLPEGKTIQAKLIEMTEEDGFGGCDYTFECVGNPDLMRSAIEACHKGWGKSVIIGVAPAGSVVQTAPFQLVTGRVWMGSAFGGVKGRTQVPEFVERHLKNEFWLSEYITDRMPIEDVNKALDLMHTPGNMSIRTVFHY